MYNAITPRHLFWSPKKLAKKGQSEYSSSMISEKEANLLQQENQALREKADLLQEESRLLQKTIGAKEETISLQDQLIEALQKQVSMLTRQLQALQDQLQEDSYDSHLPLSSVRFSHPPKRLRKKSNKKRG